MIEINSLVVLILAEAIIGLLVLSGVLLLFTLQRKGRIRKAAAHLVERVQSDGPKREKRLRVILQDRYQLAGADLEQTLHNIVQMEMLLYQNVVNGFLKDDEVLLQQMDVDVENLVLSYQGLNLPESAIDSKQGSEGYEDISKLMEENERLSEELRVTMDTMGRMLNEYTTMFSGGAIDIHKSLGTKVASDDEEMQEAGTESSDIVIEQESHEQSGMAAESTMDDEQAEVSASDLLNETEIPELTSEELESSSFLRDSDDSDTQSSEQIGALQSSSLVEDKAETDEDVSEIIEEVMEIADEMIEEEAEIAATEGESGESLVDDLEKIDIEIPETDQVLGDKSEFEAGSLEEEWAKLLEEDAANSKKQEKDNK